MKIDEFPDQPNQVFGPQTKMFEFNKDEFILAPYHTEKYIYFLISGCAASFLETDQDTICVGFYTKGDFFCEYPSFLDQSISRTYSKALKSTKVAAVHHKVLNEAYKISIDHQAKGREIAENLFKRMYERTCDLLSLDAEQRYLKFIEQRKEELNEVPLKIIASYLGMTPVSLSRIRKNIFN